jgi:tRNA 2-thiouridine synthesizing protein D
MARITIGLMDPPYESASTVTGLRIVDAALRRGHDVNVFAYEGAAALGFADQKPHANPVKGKTVEELDHPNPKDWIRGLLELATRNGVRLDWVNCGLCVDERGVEKQVEGTRRGSPADFWKLAEASDGLLFIPTR